MHMLVAMFSPQRVGLNTIIDLYILISTGSALQNVKELHVIFILVKRVAHLHFAPTHQQISTPAQSLQLYFSTPNIQASEKNNEEEKESRLTAASFCFFISIKAILYCNKVWT